MRTKIFIRSLGGLVFYHKHFRATSHFSGCIIPVALHHKHIHIDHEHSKQQQWTSERTQRRTNFLSRQFLQRQKPFLKIAQKFQYSHIFLHVHTIALPYICISPYFVSHRFLICSALPAPCRHLKRFARCSLPCFVFSR